MSTGHSPFASKARFSGSSSTSSHPAARSATSAAALADSMVDSEPDAWQSERISARHRNTMPCSMISSLPSRRLFFVACFQAEATVGVEISLLSHRE